MNSDFRDYLTRKCLKKFAVPSVINKPNTSLETFCMTNWPSSISGIEEDNVSVEPLDNQQFKGSGMKAISKSNSEGERTSFCHLCGEHIEDHLIEYAESLDNAEVSEMLSKCLPSIQVCLRLSSSSIVCSECSAHLRNYSDFIDRIIAFQRFASSTSSSSRSLEHRPAPFIKQEPIIIKQEIIESSCTRRTVDMFSAPSQISFSDEARHNAFCQHCDRIFVSNAELSLHACKGQQNGRDVTSSANNNCEIMEIITLNKPVSFIDLASDEQSAGERLVCKKEVTSDVDRRENVQIEHAYAKSLLNPLQYHLKQELETTNESEDIADESSPFYNACREDTGEEFRCTKCDRSFSTRSALNQHLRKMHSFKVKSCSVCSAEFKSVYDFLLHKNKFHGSKYQCGKCKRKFATHLILKSHERFSCLIDKGFYYTCRHCHRRIYSKLAMNDHIRKCSKQKKGTKAAATDKPPVRIREPIRVDKTIQVENKFVRINAIDDLKIC